MPAKIEVSNRNVLVVGLGISGLWSARCLAAKGARVTVSEERRQRKY